MSILKVCAVCGNGLGSSLIIEMSIKEVLEEMNIEHEVTHSNLNSFTGNGNYELVICGKDLSSQIGEGNYTKIALFNIFDKNEIKKALQDYFEKKGE